MTASAARPASTTDPTGEFPLDLTSYVFHLFAVVGRHREARLEAELKPIGLNLARHRALSVILALEPCTMSELAEYSAVDRTTLTRTVDQLVDAGLVERATPREDRRQVVLTLTDEGRRICRRSLRAIFKVSRELLWTARRSRSARCRPSAGNLPGPAGRRSAAAAAADAARRSDSAPAALGWQAADGLDVVAVGVEHERAVVVGMVVRAHAGARRCRCPPAAIAAA